MKNLSDLAKDFKQKSQQEADSIEKQMQADLQKLTNAISAELKQSEQKITKSIQEQQWRMSRAVFKPYLWSLTGILLIGLGIILGMLLWGKSIKSDIADLEQQKTEAQLSLDLLNSKTKGALIQECPTKDKNITRLCVATDPQSPQYYDKDKTREWRYIPQANIKK